ncbi:MAG: hypothetical protein ACI9XJ_001825 [Marivirga sp.]|jgi:hypothetical protein
MKKLFISLLFLISSCVSDNKKTDHHIQEKGQGELHFINTIVKLDSVKSGDTVTANFKFTNNSNESVKIEYVNPDCVCTSFSISNENLAPNDTAYIQLNFDTKGYYGYKKVPAVVKANTRSRFYMISLIVDII